jgi:hypothetical protein
VSGIGVWVSNFGFRVSVLGFRGSAFGVEAGSYLYSDAHAACLLISVWGFRGLGRVSGM